MKQKLLQKITTILFCFLFLCTGATAQESTGLNFDGINDLVTFTSVATTSTTATIECWAAITTPVAGRNQCIVYNGNSSFDGYGIFINAAGKLSVLIGGRVYRATSYSVVPNQMTHYDLVVSPTGYVITARDINGGYLGGDEYSLVPPQTTNTPTVSLKIGQPLELFTGTLDEVRIWNVQRNPQDVYNYLHCQLGAGTPNLVRYYNFAEGIPAANNNAVSFVPDRITSSANNQGTLTGFSRSGETSNYVTGVAINLSTRIYVNQNATGSNNGTSWANAFTSLSDALALQGTTAVCNTPEIWIASGTYIPVLDPTGNTSPVDERDKTFTVGTNLKIYGGFAGNETAIDERVPGNNTILSGDIGTAGDSTDNSYHVMIIKPGVTLQMDRLVITDGNANVADERVYDNYSYKTFAGGGVYSFGNLQASNIVFTHNATSDYGGAIANYNNASTFNQCVFYGNTSVLGYGNVMYNSGAATGFVGCTIAGNAGLANSGIAIYSLDNSSGPTITNSILLLNNNLGAVAEPPLLPGNATYSVIQDANVTGTGVTHSEPSFSNIANGKGPDGKWMTSDDGLHLLGCVAIDKGNNAAVTSNKDIAMQARKLNVNYVPDAGGDAAPVTDIGAYESNLSPDTTLFKGNIAGNHAVPYPQERIPDFIRSDINAILPPGVDIAYTWQKGDQDGNNITTIAGALDSIYSLPAITTTSTYQRVTHVCGVPYPGNLVKITVIKPALGNISGSVVSRGGAGVEGVTIYAQKTIDLPGSPITHIDSTLTVADGSYSFQNLFYGDPNGIPTPATVFKITPFKIRHQFSQPFLTRTLSTNNPNTGVNFIDTTALGISGQVYQECDSCVDENGVLITPKQRAPLDSVSILRTGFNNNTLSFVTKTGFLDGAYGRYNTTVTDPGNYTVKPQFNNHVFVPVQTTVTVNASIDTVDFKDTTTHIISGYVTAGCKNFIGRVVLEFSDVLPNDANNNSRPSVFHKRVVTSPDSGYYRIKLPARKYRVKVIGYLNPQSFPYPGNSPMNVAEGDLTDFFNNNARVKDSLVRDITNADTTLNLVYHRTPTIQSLSLDVDSVSACGYTIMKQTVNKIFRVTVYEGDATLAGCPVKGINDSIQIITNVEGDDTPENRWLKLDSGGTRQVILKPGIPNTVFPFTKDLQLSYPDPYNRVGGSASFIRKVLVTGIKTDRGTFATVSPQLPLMVLHDPPGDGSFSTWSNTTSNETALRMYSASNNSNEGWAEVKIGTEFSAGLGYQVPTSIWATANTRLNVSSRINTDVESIISTSNTQAYSTGNGPDEIGASGDRFIGAAINFLYSAALEVKYSGGCVVDTVRKLIVAPDSFATEYFYSEAFIKNNRIPTLQLLAQNQNNTPAQTARYLDQVKVWQQLLENNEANKQKAVFDKNISFNGGSGAGITSTTTSSATKTNTIEFNLDIDRSVALAVGLDIAGSGINIGTSYGFKMETGKSSTNTVTNEVTTGYTLADDETGDYFSVDVKKDPVYNTPVFELKAATSSCPYEDETQPRDEISLTVDTLVKRGLAPGSTTIYKFSVGNTSNSLEARSYKFGFDIGDNSNGAIVTINGTSASPVPVLVDNIPYGQSKTVTVTVQRGAGNVYSYPDLKFYAIDNCDGTVVKNLLISAFYISPCSNIILATPENNFVQTSNTLPLILKGYDTASLTSIDLEYTRAGSSNWTTGFTLLKNQLVISPNGTSVNWNIAALKDSTYKLRLKLYCTGGVVYSDAVTGIIDRQAPSLFGKPEPTDDNYVPGDIIGVSYDENISNTNLNSGKVTMKNVTDNVVIPVQVSGYENRIVIVPLNSINALTGKRIQVIVKNISDQYGNTRVLPDTFYFNVGVAAPGVGPALNVFISNASIQEAAAGTINVRFKLSQPATDSMRVNYTVSGNAVYPQDYTVAWLNPNQPAYTNHNGVQGSIMIPKNSDSAVLKIDPVDNAWFESTKNIIISLAEAGSYTIGNSNVVTGAILNDDAASIYTFTGNGNFSNAASWINGQVPPAELQTGDEIIINPSGGTCILNIPLTILPGGKITVMAGKNLVVQGNLTIRN